MGSASLGQLILLGKIFEQLGCLSLPIIANKIRFYSVLYSIAKTYCEELGLEEKIAYGSYEEVLRDSDVHADIYSFAHHSS